MLAFYDRVKTRMDHWLSHWKERMEYADLAPGERARLAHDVGLDGPTLGRIVMAPDRGQGALTGLLAALGVDEARMEREVPSMLRDMWVACAQCEAGRECQRAIAAGTVAERYRTFCPNHETIAMLRPDFQRNAC